MSTIRFSTFPRTVPPADFARDVVAVFEAHEPSISTTELVKGLTSNAVLTVLRPALMKLGFEVEAGKHKEEKILRPVFFGENGKPILQYEIDAYHADWECALEVEAGRAWMGNAVYRDLVQACVMVRVKYLVLAVPNTYKFQGQGKPMVSRDYENTIAVADALYGHTRLVMPYDLIVIGY
ncbi:MAG: hypothetical protein IIC95_09500 [Chloroflexi bacterium]|nr:hypothetical protein [Chloroflexota bacterium]